MYLPPIAHLPARKNAAQPDPLQWLRENTIPSIDEIPSHYQQSLLENRPKAAFIALVRNSEVEEMVYSMVQLEARFNSRPTHRYEWVFFNDEDFSDEFILGVTNATGSRCFFEVIPQKHWSVPSWIDTTRFDVGRQFMGSIGVGKAWLQSYHHMCRWNAGLFALEERLAQYEFFWRVEPGVEFSCDINYDVFRFMRDNDMAYGFNMAILDDARSFPSLWDRTKAFIKENKDMIHEDADYDCHDNAGKDLDHLEYNNCQFYSNFEVGSLAFFRSKEHRAYFEHLDKTGGFYYERFGDAPIHTLSVSLFLPKRRIWYFRDIGYAHGLLSCGCTVSAIDHDNAKLVPFESKQHKPVDPCIRLFLGGKWLEKREDWDQEAEIAAGRDGSGGYLLDGLEGNPFVDGAANQHG
ncbi:glycolipid 2-alpha-mannosyltransferase-domain-containing protein [Astrocystis sublimbata]|nr:glycolipid 2-alpha-mannosyltransferase-domain-containing protein [Astrocystis sublimbata]